MAKIFAVTGTIAGLVLLAVGPGASIVGASPATPVVITCSGSTAVKPSSFVLACADGNAGISKVKWSLWSSTKATGRGTFNYNSCVPYCAASRVLPYAATMALSQPKKSKGVVAFTKMVVTYKVGTSTKHFTQLLRT